MKVMVDPAGPDHWKVKKLAQILYGKRKANRSIAWAAAWGHINALWCRVMSRRESGNLRGWPGPELALAGLWPGDSRAFINALLKCRLIEKNAEGDYEIHQWVEHQGDIVSEREYERQRKANYRARTKGASPTGVPRDKRDSPTVPSPPLPSHSLPRGGDAPRPEGQDPPSASPPRTEAELAPGQQAIGFSAGTGAQKLAEALRGRGWNAASAAQRIDAATTIVGRLGVELAMDFARDPAVKAGDILHAARAASSWAERRAQAAEQDRRRQDEKRTAETSSGPQRSLEELAAGDPAALKFLRAAGLTKPPPSGGSP